MTTKEALNAANETALSKRLERYRAMCAPPGQSCERQLLDAASGRWTWCPNRLTLFDDYGLPVNRIPEIR